MSKFARRCAALMLAVVLLCMAVPAAFAAEGNTLPAGATTMGGANTTLIPDEEENCLSWLFGSGDTITMPYLNVKGQGLRRNVTLDLEDCLVGITYTELGSIGSYVSDAAAQQAWKAQAVAIHSYLEYHKKYGSSANALVYTPVDQIPSSARSAIRRAVSEVKDEVLTCNGSVIDAVWSASAGYNTQTGVYGTCSGLDAWGTDVPYLQSVESPYEEQYHNLMRRIIGKDYRYIEYNDSKTGQPYESADTTHKDLGGFVQYNTFVSNGKSYRYIGQFVSSRYCFDFSADENGTPCMNYYGFGHGVGMSQCGMVGYAQEQGMGYRDILRHYYTGVSLARWAAAARTAACSAGCGACWGCNKFCTGKRRKCGKALLKRDEIWYTIVVCKNVSGRRNGPVKWRSRNAVGESKGNKAGHGALPPAGTAHCGGAGPGNSCGAERRDPGTGKGPAPGGRGCQPLYNGCPAGRPAGGGGPRLGGDARAAARTGAAGVYRQQRG